MEAVLEGMSELYLRLCALEIHGKMKVILGHVFHLEKALG